MVHFLIMIYMCTKFHYAVDKETLRKYGRADVRMGVRTVTLNAFDHFLVGA